MARKRFITSDMSVDEKIAGIAAENPTAALMWPWFITAFDDWGRLDITSPTRIKLELFPAFPFGANEIEKAIEMYSDTGLVFRYSIDKKTYIAIEPCKYYKYQTYIREKKRIEDNSSIPAPVSAPWENCANCRALARTAADSRGFGTLSAPSPSSSPSLSKERDICAGDNTSQEKIQEKNFDTELVKINHKAFEFGMNGITPEFMEDAEMRLKEGTDPDLIIKALSIGATKANRSVGAKCRYAISVLQGWAAEGIRTIEQWEAKNAPKPKERDKPVKTWSEEREEAFERARLEARRILREEGVIQDAGDTG